MSLHLSFDRLECALSSSNNRMTSSLVSIFGPVSLRNKKKRSSISTAKKGETFFSLIAFQCGFHYYLRHVDAVVGSEMKTDPNYCENKVFFASNGFLTLMLLISRFSAFPQI